MTPAEERLIKSQDEGKSSQETLNNDVISREIPPQLTRAAEYMLTSLFAMIFLAISIRIIYKDSILKSAFDVVTMTSIFYMTLVMCAMILRVCNFLTESQLVKTHYDNRIMSVLKATFEINGQSLFVIAFCLIALSVYFVKEGNPVILTWAHGPLACFSVFVLSYILSYVGNLNGTNYMTARTIRSMAGVDYGGGMAFSYFYGYLRIVLPGLRHKMEAYEAEQGVTIPVKKMFILIPESGHIPPDLCDASYQWLEGTTNLEHIVQDRAGVKRRNYKNTVYKIHPDGREKGHRPVYVTTEGATPMLTFWEILIHDHQQTATYKQNRMQIVASFYQTLHELIDNDPECRDVCELVYYKDYDNRKKINVAEILLKRIHAEAPLS